MSFKKQPNQTDGTSQLIDTLERQLRQVRARLLVPGDKVDFTYGGDQGFSVIIPDPSDERCPHCLSSECLEYLDMEAENAQEFEVRFECKNIVQDELGKYECQGRVIIKESV